tara:strand:- start:204 stop:326 length:123 start_codon:yes stop_codon:yes gene_type:complete
MGETLAWFFCAAFAGGCGWYLAQAFIDLLISFLIGEENDG